MDSGAEMEPAGTIRGKVGRVLENRWFETFVLALVLVDVALVTVEAGIDTRLLCFEGEEVPFGSPAGAHLRLAHHGGGHSGGHGGGGHHGGGHHGGHHEGDAHGHSLLSERSLPSLPLQGVNGLIQRRRAAARRLDADGDFSLATEVGQLDARASKLHLHPPPVELVLHRHSPESHGDKLGHGHQPDVLVCLGRKSHTVHHIVHTCHFWSVVILCMFALELLLKIWAIPDFLDNAWHKLDCVVVFLSLFIDTFVVWLISRMKDNDPEKKEEWEAEAIIVAGLLLFTRIWRVVRIIHGLHEFEETKMKLEAEEHERAAEDTHRSESV